MRNNTTKSETRSVWENKNGSRVTTVTGFLDVGRYKIEKETKDDGTVVLTYEPVDD